MPPQQVPVCITPQVTVLGTSDSTMRLRGFLAQHAVLFHGLDVSDSTCRALMTRYRISNLPAVLVGDRAMEDPDESELAEALGLPQQDSRISNEEFVEEFIGLLGISGADQTEIVRALRAMRVDGVDKILGHGTYAVAAALTEKKIIKLTTDDSELCSARHLVGKKLEHVVRVYDSRMVPYSIVSTEYAESKPVGIIIAERVIPIDSAIGPGRKLTNISFEVKSEHEVWPNQLPDYSPAELRERLQAASSDLAVRFQLQEDELLRQCAEGIRELVSQGIYTVDVHGENVGYVDDPSSGERTYKIFDVGVSSCPLPEGSVPPAAAETRRAATSYPQDMNAKDCVGIHTHTPVDISQVLQGAQEVEARDYIAVDTHGRRVWGPSKDYSEAKRQADRAGGVVQWIPAAAAEDVFGRSVRWTFDGHVYQGTGRKGDYLIVPVRGPVFVVYTVRIDTYGGINKNEIGSAPDHTKAMQLADAYDLEEIQPDSVPSTKRERTRPPVAVAAHEANESVPVIYEEAGKQPTFAQIRDMLLAGLREHGWTVASDLKVPHATSPNGKTRLWFKSQAIYINDPGTDPRQFSSTHSLSSDMRQYGSVDALLASVERWNSPREEAQETSPAPSMDCLPWVRVTRDPERYEACLAQARKIGPIDNARKVYDLLSPALSKEDNEVLCVVLLDVRRQLRGVSEVHRGQRSRVSVGVTDVMRIVIASGAEAFVCTHNHPSGTSIPSSSDISLTKSIDKACAPFGKDLTFLGQVVLGMGEFSEISPSGKASKTYKVK